MKPIRIALVVGLLLAGCAPGRLGPPPAGGAYQVGPYPTTPRAAAPTGDGLFARIGPDGLSLGLRQAPWQGELVGVGGAAGGAKLRGAWSRGRYAVQAEAAYLFFTTERWDGEGSRTLEHRAFGLALDASYLWEVPVRYGRAYAGPRARAYWSAAKVNDGPYRPAEGGLLPGVVLGVNLPVPVTEGRLVFGLEASLFVVSPWLTSEAEWSAFSPLSIGLSYRF